MLDKDLHGVDDRRDDYAARLMHTEEHSERHHEHAWTSRVVRVVQAIGNEDYADTLEGLKRDEPICQTSPEVA